VCAGLIGASVIVLVGLVARAGVSGQGRFAGYVWFGRVQEISGQWVVPRIEKDSHAGRAGSWIGAVDATGHSDTDRFIQVGTNEMRVAGTALRIGDLRLVPDLYYAFWSSTQDQFHPVYLFPVNAGDQITASLALRGKRWRVSITDVTSQRSATFTTRQETGAAFNQAQWLQEDITDAKTGRPFPYPRLTPLRFSKVKVNRRIPTLAQVHDQQMSVGDGTETPTELNRGSFVVAGTTPS